MINQYRHPCSTDYPCSTVLSFIGSLVFSVRSCPIIRAVHIACT